MTWGQIRFLLQKAVPGFDLDQLDGFLTARYEQILNHRDWNGLHGHATIQTQAAYLSGTDSVTTTVGNANITGAGTTWTTSLQVGLKLVVAGDTEFYTVAAIGSDTSVTLDRPYEGKSGDAVGTVAAGQAYLAFQNVYALPADCKIIEAVENPLTGYPMPGMTKDELDLSAGPRNYVDDPASYCPYDDGSELTPPVLHQIEFYPPPQFSRGYPVRYQRSAYQFDGTNTGAAPLPWVEVTGLLDGCRADVYALLAAQGSTTAAGSVAFYEAKFEKSLARMTRQDLLRGPYARVQMANRFVRHRLERSMRGYSRGWGPGQGGPN